MTNLSKFVHAINEPRIVFKVNEAGQIIETWWKGDDMPLRLEFHELKHNEIDLITENDILSFDKVNAVLMSCLAQYRATIEKQNRLEDSGPLSPENEKLIANEFKIINAKETRAIELIKACPVRSVLDAVKICHAMSHPDLCEIIGGDVRAICERALFLAEFAEAA